MSDNYVPVVFEDSLGNEISNDPVWLARRTLEQYQATAGYNQGPLVPASQQDDGDDDLDAPEGPEDYKGLNGTALKELAAERGVDITGLTKVGQVRSALIEDDTAKAAAAELEAANTAEDDK